jgi:D-glycero-D-manno-heptose 1,7-bisphosphate phosphatase
VITNQAGIAHGYFKEQDVENLHNYINTKLFEKGAHIDKFYFCPFHEQAKILKYKKKTNYRKPGNGMLLEALRDFRIKKNKSFFIGDQKSDEICAKKTSIKFEYAKGSILNIVKKKLYEKK